MGKASLWREGLKNFNRHWREWLPLAIIFFFIIGVGNVLFASFSPDLKSQMTGLAVQKDPLAVSHFFATKGPSITLFLILTVLALFIQRYVFLSFFMRKELPAETRPASVRDFFCFLVKSIQLSFIATPPFLILGILIGIAISVLHLTSGIVTTFCVAFLGAIPLVIWLLLRLMIVLPLAAGKIKAPIKTSWRLTEGKVLRLLGNLLVLGLLFIGGYLALALVLFVIGIIVGVVATLGGQGSLAAFGVLAPVFIKCVIGSALQVVITGITLAYVSAASRILYEEKKQADPNFILETRN